MLTTSQDKLKKEQLSDYFTWVKAIWVTGRGTPLEFKTRPFLEQIYTDQYPYIVYQKAAQMGLSERSISEAVWICDQLGVNVLYCVDNETTLLTKRGWLYYYQLKKDDIILTLNPQTEKSEWSNLDEIFIKDTKTKMVLLENNFISSLTTPDHRWLIRKKARGINYSLQWETTNTIKKGENLILRAVEHNLSPEKNKYSDDFVELLAWVYTEGHYIEKNNNKVSNVVITQSYEKNKDKTVKIELLLLRMNIRYKRYDIGHGCYQYRMTGNIPMEIRKKFPDKTLTVDFIYSLTKKQLNIFIETSILADGWVRTKKQSCKCFAQRNEQRADIFLLACILNGMAVSKKYRKNDMFVIRILSFKTSYARELHRTNIDYNGIVWCPRTKNGTFLAQRKGTIYWTGNTFPTQTHLQDFVQARIEPVLAGSEYLRSLTTKSNINDRQIMKIGLKKIGKGFLYLRGSQNEKQIITIDADCYDDKTELLTEHGWKLFKNLLPKEKVVTLNPETDSLEYHIPTHYINYQWSGTLLSIEQEQVNFAVKPTHKLYLKKQRKEFNLHTASDVYGLTHLEFQKNAQWNGKNITHWIIPGLKKSWLCGHHRQQILEKTYIEKKVLAPEFLEFLGLYIAEGSVSKQHSRWYNVVRLGQNPGKTFDRILYLAQQLGFKTKIYPNYQNEKCQEIRIYSTQLACYFAKFCGVGSYNKKISKSILRLSKNLLYKLFNGLMAGDGTGGHSYCTNSHQLSLDFEQLILRLGLSCSTSINNAKSINIKKRYVVTRPCYRIGINFRKNTPRINKLDWKKIPYNGFLYSITIKNHIIYVRRKNATSAHWSGNCVFMDERDRFTQSNVPYIEKRLLASKLKWIREISTPTYPGQGINASYLKSDQRVWQIECKKCGLWQELDFFKHVDFDKKTIKCSQCAEVLDRLSMGRWHISNPESKIHGYKINGLYNPLMTIADVIEKYDEASTSGYSSLQQFFNQNLGLPYEATGQKLNISEVQECKREYMMPIMPKTQVFAGADVGVSFIHTVVLQKLPYDKYRVIWAGTVKKFLGPLSSLELIMNKYNVKLMVVDKKPETQKLKDLMELFPHKVYAATYPNMNFTTKEYYIFDDINSEVRLDRTISLDYIVGDIQGQRVELPKNIENIEGFYEQLTNSVRITEKNARTGVENSRWIEKGDDHYLHAFNYARIAQIRGIVGKALLDYYGKPSMVNSPNFIDWLRVNGQRIS